MDERKIEKELDEILAAYHAFRARQQREQERDIDHQQTDQGKVPDAETDISREEEIGQLVARVVAAVERISGRDSEYRLGISAFIDKEPVTSDSTALVFGVVKALRDDIQNGRFQPVAAPFHFDAETFGGFLDVAMQQLSRGDCKAAVVLAGSTLEKHLNKLATKNGLDIENEEGNALPVARTVRELAGKGVFDSKEQQRVEEWLALRKAASTGVADPITEDQVRTMIAGIKAFLLRNPA